MNRYSIVASLAAAALGTAMLFGGAGAAAAQSCDTCSQSTGAGAGKFPRAEPLARIVPVRHESVEENQFFRGSLADSIQVDFQTSLLDPAPEESIASVPVEFFGQP